ncbi:MAG: hypothetical protein AAF399_10620 [Bacteroidota bacterium]
MIKKIQTYGCHLLLWSGLLGMIPALVAQPHNGEWYQQVLEEHIEARGATASAVLGLEIPALLTLWNLDSTATTHLQLYPPTISYQTLDDRHYQRSLQLTIQERIEEEEAVFSYQRMDTLSAPDFQKVWKNSPPVLRGEDPRNRARIGKPIALIGSSILLIVSLFYLRSQ